MPLILTDFSPVMITGKIKTRAGHLAGSRCMFTYFLKLSFRDTLRLNTRCWAELSRLSRQK